MSSCAWAGPGRHLTPDRRRQAHTGERQSYADSLKDCWVVRLRKAREQLKVRRLRTIKATQSTLCSIPVVHTLQRTMFGLVFSVHNASHAEPSAAVVFRGYKSTTARVHLLFLA